MTPKARDHGPLPALLVAVTIMTGLIDSVTYLELGNVFVANVTGNIIFIGFAVGGRASGTILSTLMSALFFCVGAALGGRLALDRLAHRGLLLSVASTLQACAFAVAALVMTSYGHTGAPERHVLIAILAASMGWQFAVVRRLDVPDFRTIVITTTLTSLVADGAQSKERLVRKTASVGALLAGATAGPVLIRKVAVTAPLWVAAALLLAVAAASFAASRREGADRWG